LEAYAEGLDIKNGDSPSGLILQQLPKFDKIIDRRVGRNLTTEEATLLAKDVNDKVQLKGATFKFKKLLYNLNIGTEESL